MNKPHLTPALLVLVAVAALVLGSLGTAVAGPALTQAKVKKIASKVVAKQASGLTVAHAAAATVASTATTATTADKLAGRPPSAFQDSSEIYIVNVTTAVMTKDVVLPLTPGDYLITWSALMSGASGNSECAVRQQGPGPASFYTADETTSAANQALSASGYLHVVAGQKNAVTCTSDTPWTTVSNEPLQVVVTPLDTASVVTLP